MGLIALAKVTDWTGLDWRTAHGINYPRRERGIETYSTVTAATNKCLANHPHRHPSIRSHPSAFDWTGQMMILPINNERFRYSAISGKAFETRSKNSEWTREMIIQLITTTFPTYVICNGDPCRPVSVSVSVRLSLSIGMNEYINVVSSDWNKINLSPLKSATKHQFVMVAKTVADRQ